MKRKILVGLTIGLLILGTFGFANAIVLDFEGQGFGNNTSLAGS
jgi:hypothetical protein